MRRTGSVRYAAFMPMSFLRAFWRAVGMVHGTLAYLSERLTGRDRRRRVVE
jgi:hypothetical protein